MADNAWTVPKLELLERVRARLEDESRPENEDATAVLATVVDAEGNAYRRPGAKLLFDADGEGIESITAGCLEEELRTAAATVREAGRPRLVSYDPREGDEPDVLGSASAVIGPLGQSPSRIRSDRIAGRNPRRESDSLRGWSRR